MSAQHSNGSKPKVCVRQPQRMAPPQGSAQAKRLAAAILEVLAGSRTPTNAAQVLGTSLPRYYLLEQRALQGLLGACEPRPKGRVVSETGKLAALEKQVAKLQRECGRQQALLRAAQRAVGLAAPPPPKPKAPGSGRKGRQRRPTARALKAAAALRADSSLAEQPDAVQPMAQGG
jgi:hypothetical protein